MDSNSQEIPTILGSPYWELRTRTKSIFFLHLLPPILLEVSFTSQMSYLHLIQSQESYDEHSSDVG